MYVCLHQFPTRLTRRSLPFHVTDQDRDAVLLASFKTEAQPCFPAFNANDPRVFLCTLHPLCVVCSQLNNTARCGARPLASAGGVPRGVSRNNYGGKFKMEPASKTGDVKNNLMKFIKLVRKMKLEADPPVEQ